MFLQFNSRINRGFNFCEYSLSEEIRGILLCKYEFCKNIYLPKYIFRKHLFLSGNTKILVSYIDISVSGSSALYFLNVQTLLIKVNSKELFQFLRVQFNALIYEFMNFQRILQHLIYKTIRRRYNSN